MNGFKSIATWYHEKDVVSRRYHGRDTGVIQKLLEPVEWIENPLFLQVSINGLWGFGTSIEKTAKSGSNQTRFWGARKSEKKREKRRKNEIPRFDTGVIPARDTKRETKK